MKQPEIQLKNLERTLEIYTPENRPDMAELLKLDVNECVKLYHSMLETCKEDQ